MSTMFEKLASQNKKKAGSFAKLFSTHPQSIDRRDTSISLVSRFPEKEEYVISTSEFQKIKSYLLKQTNAKAGVAGDIEAAADEGRPTLKKRQPDAPDSSDGSSTTPDSSSSSTSDGPPKLKKRENSEPAPTPTPE
jgi:hypothetical protein